MPCGSSRSGSNWKSRLPRDNKLPPPRHASQVSVMPSTDLLLSVLSQRLTALFEDLNRRPVRMVHLEFYPYSRFSSTIRFRDGVLKIRLSDLLKAAPEPVVEAFGTKLVYKISGRKIPDSVSEQCRRFLDLPETREREKSLRRQRGRKRILPPSGDVFDLGRLFQSLNRDFFSDSLAVDRLGWSVSKSRRRLGHYDPAHHAIVLNRRLDNPLVPEYVVSFILYHEMLHASFALLDGNGKRRVHDRRFRLAEHRHPDRQRALRFIDEHF